MSIRSKGPGAGFGWLTRGIGSGFRRPKPLFGAAALLLIACLLPMLVTLPMRLHAMHLGTPPSVVSIVVTTVGSALFGLLIVPLYAGYLQVIDAAERGLPARARDIFTPYRRGEALSLIGYGLVLVVAYVVMAGVVILVTGGGIAGWYMQMLSAQTLHQAPPSLPHGFWTAMALFAVLGLFMTAFYAISLGQVALGQRSVFGAVGDGLVGALKNVLPMLVLALSLTVAWVAAIVVIGIVALVLALLAKAVGAWLMLLFIIPVYIALVLFIYVSMFGVMYHLWRDVCGGDAMAAMPPPLTA